MVTAKNCATAFNISNDPIADSVTAATDVNSNPTEGVPPEFTEANFRGKRPSRARARLIRGFAIKYALSMPRIERVANRVRIWPLRGPKSALIASAPAKGEPASCDIGRT